MVDRYYLIDMETGEVIFELHDPYQMTVQINRVIQWKGYRLKQLAVSLNGEEEWNADDFINIYPI